MPAITDIQVQRLSGLHPLSVKPERSALRAKKGDKRVIRATTGAIGADGKSAYELALSSGFDGSLQDWLASLVGKQGEKGRDRRTGRKRVRPAHRAKKGDTGADGKSAYELACEQGYTGTLIEWLTSLVGAKGDTGADGAQGEKRRQRVKKGDKGDNGAQG